MTNTTTSSPSVLASLRGLTPRCRLDFEDTKQLAERQARTLARLLAVGEDGVLDRHVASLPRLRVVYEALPTSGLSYWNGREWILAICQDDTSARQRFTLLHELKHVIDHPHRARLYRSDWEAERAADYFAACALMPKPALKRMYCNVTQRIEALAAHFGVSQAALRYRLEQIGLLERPTFTRQRCARPVSTPPWQEQRFRTVEMSRST